MSKSGTAPVESEIGTFSLAQLIWNSPFPTLTLLPLYFQSSVSHLLQRFLILPWPLSSAQPRGST